MTEQLQFDWSSAEVSDGELSVGLSAKPPKKWQAAFTRTAALLSAGTWEITLDAKQGSVRVASLAPGDEDRVRQLVEGAALEANATLVSEGELFGDPPAEDDDPEHDTDEPSRDQELTQRFRAFAEPHDEGDRGD